VQHVNKTILKFLYVLKSKADNWTVQ